MRKVENQDEQVPLPTPSVPYWHIVGNCTAVGCGNPIFAKSADFFDQPAHFMLSTEPSGPPRVYRTCGCKPFTPAPGARALGGSFRFTLDEDAAQALVLALPPSSHNTSAADETTKTPIVSPSSLETDHTVFFLPPTSVDTRPLGDRPDWFRNILDENITRLQAEAAQGQGSVLGEVPQEKLV